MKIGLITPANLWFCPYVQIYRRILEDYDILYDIITWCRDGNDEDGCIQYKEKQKKNNLVYKFLSYLSFASFVKKKVKENKYDKLIVFTPQVGIFISSFLKRYYRRNYIFDYRDLSIEQKWYFKKSFIRLLDNSAANVISSPGFKRYLPQGYDFILSHNFDITIVKSVLNKSSSALIENNDYIDVLTIGGIRDFESNKQVIDALANNKRFRVRFVGKGPAADSLKAYSERIGASNISFEGFYLKEKEKDYIAESTILNIFYPRSPSHDTALSNRFYNSLIYYKPMITTKNTTQGDYASKYNVGIALTDCSNLADDLETFINQIDREEYSKQCNLLLKEFVGDYDRFVSILNNFFNGVPLRDC